MLDFLLVNLIDYATSIIIIGLSNHSQKMAAIRNCYEGICTKYSMKHFGHAIEKAMSVSHNFVSRTKKR